MSRTLRWIFAWSVLLTVAPVVSADDVTGSDELLCSPMMVNGCKLEEGCEATTPWALNVPRFIEVDLANRKMSTTEASGLNRATEINNLLREDGLIVLQGYQQRRAFSMVITEQTGMLTFSVSGADAGAVIFGACTPMP